MDAERLMQHAKCTTWKGANDTAKHQVFTRNPLCGDQVTLFFNITHGAVSEVRFQGQGCIVSQSCASMLCEGIEGKTPASIIDTPLAELLDYEIDELTPLRQKCAQLAALALVEYLNNYKSLENLS